MYHNNVLEFYIVTTDENECNWMMFVRKARYDTELSKIKKCTSDFSIQIVSVCDQQLFQSSQYANKESLFAVFLCV